VEVVWEHPRCDFWYQTNEDFKVHLLVLLAARGVAGIGGSTVNCGGHGARWCLPCPCFLSWRRRKREGKWRRGVREAAAVSRRKGQRKGRITWGAVVGAEEDHAMGKKRFTLPA
jgi:hypothetical protein